MWEETIFVRQGPKTIQNIVAPQKKTTQTSIALRTKVRVVVLQLHLLLQNRSLLRFWYLNVGPNAFYGNELSVNMQWCHTPKSGLLGTMRIFI